MNICKKMGPFFWGMPPAVAPKGYLVFGGIYICTTNWGVGYVNYKRNLEILSNVRSDIVVGCSKH
jgi:hypothetical protein